MRLWPSALGATLACGLIPPYAMLFGPLDPAAFEPGPPLPMTGPLTPNIVLQSTEALGAGEIQDPEDVDVDGEGWIYGSTVTGEIRRLRGGVIEVFADTGGRPLGLDFGPDGALFVADAERGLLEISPKGEIRVLSTEAEGLPFRFADDVDVAADGTVYFTDASHKFNLEDTTLDLMEARPNGRLLRYNPYTQRTDVLIPELYFANGVALSEDESFLLVNETGRYRTLRHQLTGPKAGTTEVILDNLPGFPDGVSRGSDGVFWLPLFTTRKPLVDHHLHPRPWLKSVVGILPAFMLPKAVPTGLVLAIDGEGNILSSLQDPEGEVAQAVTSVEEIGGMLYLGSLHNDRILRLPRPRVKGKMKGGLNE